MNALIELVKATEVGTIIINLYPKMTLDYHGGEIRELSKRGIKVK